MKLLNSKFKKCLLGISILVLFLSFVEFFSLKNENEEDKQKRSLKILYQALSNLHYKKLNLDENFSIKIYKKYLENLDPQKIYFTYKDIENLSSYEKTLAEDIKKTNLDFFYKATSIYQKRILEIKTLSNEILSHPFNFKLDESLEIEVKNLDYPKKEKDRKNRYKKYLKYRTLVEIYSLWKENKANKNKFKILEKESRKKVKEQINDYFNLLKNNSISYYFPLFLNTISSQYDPHTNYFSPKDMEDFTLSISGQLQGIGAVLSYEKGYIVIKELIAGGPAFKSKKIEIGDKIIKVGNSPIKSKNIVGMPLNKSVSLIRGKKNTPVYLTLQRKEEIKEVKLIRDTIEIQEVFARSAILKDDLGNLYGLINLPEFYFNLSDKTGRNAAEDVKKELKLLEKQNVKGLIFDLRNNGGGSLEAATNISGFFIGKNPIVQTLISNGKKQIISNNKEKMIWNKPLIVLVNESSASASEIFAAVIQDYKRGIILGSKQTHGKGSVQSLFDFNKMYTFDSDKSQEALKFTISKFYRVNGESTQLKGLIPDVILPSIGDYMKIGERNQENPLPWDKIEATNFSPFNENDSTFNQAIKNASLRIRENKNYKLLNKVYKEIGKKPDNVSLNWEKFIKTNKSKEKEEKIKFIENYSNKLNVKLLNSKLSSESSKEWKKNIEKDFFIEEGVYLLKDLLSISKKK